VAKAEGDPPEVSSLSLFLDMAMGLPAGCEVVASWAHLRDLSYLKRCSPFRTLGVLDGFDLRWTAQGAVEYLTRLRVSKATIRHILISVGLEAV
jgi:hypothetical protein